MGYKAHFGAGVIASNLRSDKRSVKIGKIDTELKKLGSIVGDFVEVGCNSVLCPGTIVGRGSVIYPLKMVRGIVESETIYK